MKISKPSKPDDIYANATGRPAPFQFNQQVVNVFPDMISRSVPGYDLSLELIGLIGQMFVQPGSSVYDLGCSLGAGIQAMRPFLQTDSCRIIGIDSSEAMVDQCRANLAKPVGGAPITIDQANIKGYPIDNASLVIMNYTLQFIEQSERQQIVNDIYAGLNEGGAFFLSEKVIFSDEKKNSRFIDLHHSYKRMQGYSDLEIAQKRDAIMNVLVPETIEDHKARLTQAGFRTAEICLQGINFVSLLAIK
ncbi:MAG: carboxy-S-adenosyl-L-methionine synthase CmoA [Chloroflexota bacterium]